MVNLSKSNNDISIIDKNIISNWNTVIHTLSINSIDRVISIEGTIAEKYRLDMYGLFKHLEIQEEFIYPHIRVNGYTSSRQYMGDKVNIKLLDLKTLNVYYDMFSQ